MLHKNRLQWEFYISPSPAISSPVDKDGRSRHVTAVMRFAMELGRGGGGRSCWGCLSLVLLRRGGGRGTSVACTSGVDEMGCTSCTLLSLSRECTAEIGGCTGEIRCCTGVSNMRCRGISININGCGSESIAIATGEGGESGCGICVR